MKDYIERASVHSIIERTSTFAFTRGGMHEQVDSLPAADVVEVRHGRWKNGGNGLYDTCTACGKEIYLAIPMNYCPECGALMREIENGEK